MQKEYEEAKIAKAVGWEGGINATRGLTQDLSSKENRLQEIKDSGLGLMRLVKDMAACSVLIPCTCLHDGQKRRRGAKCDPSRSSAALVENRTFAGASDKAEK